MVYGLQMRQRTQKQLNVIRFVECYSTLGRVMGTSTEGQTAAYVSIPGPSPMRALRRSWRVTE